MDILSHSSDESLMTNLNTFADFSDFISDCNCLVILNAYSLLGNAFRSHVPSMELAAPSVELALASGSIRSIRFLFPSSVLRA